MSSSIDNVYLYYVENTKLENLTLLNEYRGIFLYKSDKITIANVSSKPYGLLKIDQSTMVDVYDVSFDIGRGLIRVVDSTDIRLMRCDVRGVYGGIVLEDCTTVDMIECNSSDNQIGLDVDSSDGCRILRCTFLNNSMFSTILRGMDNSMTGTTMGSRGLWINGYGYPDIDDTNTVGGKPLIYLMNKTGYTIDSNAGQICLLNSSDIHVSNLTFNNTAIPIQLYKVSDSTFKNITTLNASLSLESIFSDNCTFKDFNTRLEPLTDRTGFIRLRDSSNLTVDGCLISGEYRYGIDMSNSEDYGHIVLTNINVYYSDVLGLSLRGGHNVTLSNVEVWESKLNGVSCSGQSVSIMNLTIHQAPRTGMRLSECSVGSLQGFKSANNTEGLRIDYINGWLLEDIVISDCTDAAIRVTNSGYCQFTNISIERSKIGIEWIVSESTIRNLTVKDCERGIWMLGYRTYIIDSFFQNISMTGIRADWCRENSIIGCNFTDCQTGIDIIEGRNGRIDGNEFTSCMFGILAYRISDSNYTNNWFWSCERTSIAASGFGSSENYIYHNCMIKNNYNATTDTYNGPQASGGGVNFDNGEEGNYWSDYRRRYPSAGRVGRIWDTAYVINEDTFAYDNFPLATLVDHESPVADAGMDITIDQNTSVRFNGTGSDDNYGVVSYYWTFTYNHKDINLSGRRPSFTFDSPGIYLVNLTVQDDWGHQSNDQMNVTVVDTQAPLAIAGPDITVDMGVKFSLNASLSWDNSGTFICKWLVDPGGLSMVLDGEEVHATIDKPGDYLIILNVTDNTGNWATDDLEIHVIDIIPPFADAGEDVLIDQGETITFDGSASTDNVGIDEWFWSFIYEGKTINLTGSKPSFTFEIPGMYEVSLKVTDVAGLSRTDTSTVTVNDTEQPIAVVGENMEVDQWTGVHLSAIGSSDNVGIVIYEWSFKLGGENKIMDGAETYFVFEDPGIYKIMLTVEDAASNQARAVMTITVIDTMPPAAIINLGPQVDQNTVVTLDGSSSSDNVGIVNFQWSLTGPEGIQELQGPSPIYIFTITGNYQISLTVEDGQGNSGNRMIDLVVVDTEPPVADGGEDKDIYEGSLLTLDAGLSTDNVAIDRYVWMINNTLSDWMRQGITTDFLFEQPGDYMVTISVYDEAGNIGKAYVNITVLSLDDEWFLGPFIDPDGEPIAGVDVMILMNSTRYNGTTDEDGMIRPLISVFDAVGSVKVTASKTGLKSMIITLTLDSDGRPTEDLPPMVNEAEPTTSSTPMMLIAVIIIIIVIVAVLWIVQDKRKPT